MTQGMVAHSAKHGRTVLEKGVGELQDLPLVLFIYFHVLGRNQSKQRPRLLYLWFPPKQLF